MAFVDFGGFLGAMPDYESRRRQAVQDFSGFGAAGLVGLDVYRQKKTTDRLKEALDIYDYAPDEGLTLDVDKDTLEQELQRRLEEQNKILPLTQEAKDYLILNEPEAIVKEPEAQPRLRGGMGIPSGLISPMDRIDQDMGELISDGLASADQSKPEIDIGALRGVVTEEMTQKQRQAMVDQFGEDAVTRLEKFRDIYGDAKSDADKFRRVAMRIAPYNPKKSDELMDYANKREEFEIQVGAEKEARQDQLRQSALIRTEQQIGELNSEILNLQQIRKGLSPDEQTLINRVDNRVSTLGNEINRLQSAKKSLAAGGLLEDVYNEIPSFTLRDNEPEKPTAGYKPDVGNTEAEEAEEEEALGIPTIKYKDDINKVKYALKELVQKGKMTQDEADRRFGLAKLKVANVPVRGAAEKEAKRLRSVALKFKNTQKNLIDKTDDIKIIKTLQSNYNKALGLVDEAKKGNASAAQSIIIFAVKSTDPNSAVMEGEGKAQREQSYISQARDILNSLSGKDPRTQARYIDDQIESIRKNTEGEMNTRLPSITSTLSISNAELLDKDKSFKDTLSLKDFGIIDNLSGTGKPEPKPVPEPKPAPEETSNIQPVGYTSDDEEIY